MSEEKQLFSASLAKDAVYKTPKDVFDAYFDALNKRDSKAMLGCLPPEAVKSMAATTAPFPAA